MAEEDLICVKDTELCSRVVLWKQDPRPPLPEHVSDAITDFLLQCFQKVCVTEQLVSFRAEGPVHGA